MQGDVDLDFNFALEFVDGDSSFPSLGADFYLDWAFDQTLSTQNPLGDLTVFGESPEAGFTDVSLELGAYISNVVGPAIELVQTLAAPLQPINDAYRAPLPLLSDLAEWIDFADGEVSLYDIVEVIDDSNLLPPVYDVIVSLLGTVSDVIAFVDMFESNASGLSMSFGDFNVSGVDGTTDLRAITAAIDPSAGVATTDWSSLAANVTKAVNDQLGHVPPEVRRILGVGSQQPVANFDYSLPLLENPETGVFQLLLGRDVDLIRVDLVLDAPIPLGPKFDFSFLGIASLDFDPGTIDLFTDIGVGYDTYGLRQVATQAAQGQPLDLAVLQDGFYIENAHTTDDQGNVHDVQEFQIGLNANIDAGLNGGLFKLEAGGGITADFGFGIADDGLSGDFDPGKVRQFTELEPCSFTLTGGLSAYLDFLVQIGVDFGFGFVGFEVDEHLGGTIVDFDAGGSCIPATELVNFNDVTDTLSLNPGREGADDDERITIERLVTLVDHDANEETARAERDTIRITRLRNNVAPDSVDFIIREPGDTNEALNTINSLQRIVAAGEGGNDTIHVRASIGNVNADLFGSSAQANDISYEHDTLIYEGTGTGSLVGGGGDDTLRGGAGTNLLLGEGGYDELFAGEGTNTLDGGSQDDTLLGNGLMTIAFGGLGDDTIDGGTTELAYLYGDYAAAGANDGDDVIYAADGDTHAWGGNGTNELHGSYGQGALTYVGGVGFAAGGFGVDKVFLLGSTGDDTISIERSATGADVDVRMTPAGDSEWLVRLFDVERLTSEGGRGADQTNVAELYGTGITEVNVNLADDASFLLAGDVTTVHGADDIGELLAPRWDQATIETGYVSKIPGAVFFSPAQEDLIWSTGARNAIDGVTIVRLADLRLERNDGIWSTEEQSAYVVSVGNQTAENDSDPQDELFVRLHDGAAGLVPDSLEVFGETAEINSVPGGTNLDMGAGTDFIRVNLTEQQESQMTASGFTIDPGGYYGQLNIDAGAGDGIIQFDAGLHPLDGGAEGEVNITLRQDRLRVDSDGWILVDDQGYVSEGLPVADRPINFTATGGQYTRVDLRGSDGRVGGQHGVLERSTIAIQGTLPTAFTTIYASNHDIVVSSDANFESLAQGHLTQIEGPLKLIAENLFGVHEPVTLTLSDFAATNGNRAASVIKVTPALAGLPLYDQFQNANVALGFAGPHDDVVIGWETNFDQLPVPLIEQVVLRGSNNELLRERFVLGKDLNHNVQIEAGDGPDRIEVLSNAVAEVDVFTGGGQDYVTIGYEPAFNVYHRDPVRVFGDPASWDQLRIDDRAGTSAAYYFLDNDTLTTGPTPTFLSETITFSNINDIQLTTTEAGAIVGVGDGLQAGLFPPRSRISMPGTDDIVGAGIRQPGSGNLWNVRGPNEVILNKLHSITGAENLLGGPVGDHFLMSAGGSISGDIAGAIAPNTLDYRARTEAVEVDLTHGTATSVGGNISWMNNVLGSKSENDRLIGFGSFNPIWHLTGEDAGHILQPDLFNLRTDYQSFETLVTGADDDALNFYDDTMVTNGIELGPNQAGSFDGVDFERVTKDVIANLNGGAIEYGEEGSYSTIATVDDAAFDWAFGGSGDDILIGTPGHNVLVGRAGHDVLIGNGGDDWLLGDEGNDVLIGGLGTDAISGGRGEDIVIGGYTIYDNSLPQLIAIRDIWRRSDVGYAQRIAMLRSGPVALVLDSTVFVDLSVDQLDGGLGLDWFWGGFNDQADIDFATEQYL